MDCWALAHLEDSMKFLQVFNTGAPGRWTLGWKIAGKWFRDPRFAPSLSFHEASWLLENETGRRATNKLTAFAEKAKKSR
jgi:hypothetical protein